MCSFNETPGRSVLQSGQRVLTARATRTSLAPGAGVTATSSEEARGGFQLVQEVLVGYSFWTASNWFPSIPEPLAGAPVPDP